MMLPNQPTQVLRSVHSLQLAKNGHTVWWYRVLRGNVKQGLMWWRGRPFWGKSHLLSGWPSHIGCCCLNPLRTTVWLEVALGYTSAQITILCQRLSCYSSVHAGWLYSLRWDTHHISQGILRYNEPSSVSSGAGVCVQRAAFAGGLDRKLMTSSFNPGSRAAMLFEIWSRQ